MPRINLSISEDLYKQLHKAADKQKITVNTLILDTLEDKFNTAVRYDYTAALKLMASESKKMKKEFTLSDLPTCADVEQVLIENNIKEPITIDELARKFYVSKSYISHTFKENQGVSLHQYIMKRRLQLFRESVREGGDIKSTYLNCGFNDYSSFYRAFKQEYGISPNTYKTETMRTTMEHMVSQQSHDKEKDK